MIRQQIHHIPSHTSQDVLRLDHHSHAQSDHIDIDLLIAHGVHLQKIIRLGLPVLRLIDIVQLLQKDLLQLLYPQINLLQVTLTLLVLVPLITTLQTNYRLLEVVYQISMDLLYRPVLNTPHQVLQLLQTLKTMMNTHQLVSRLELYYHQPLPVIQSRQVLHRPLLVIPAPQKLLKNLNKLRLHQKVTHSLDNIVVPTSGQQHMVNPLPEQRKHNTAQEITQHVQVTQHLQQRIRLEIVTNRNYYRRLTDLSHVENYRR